MGNSESISPENIRPIGGKWLEATCKKCGEIFPVTQGDDLFIEVDEQKKAWPLCSKCYDGPRASRKKIDDTLGNLGNDADGDPA